MRSVILVISTAFVLTMAGLIYFWNSGRGHPTLAHQSQADLNVPMPRSTDRDLRSSPGNDASVKKYDPKTGKLAAEYAAEEYTPRRGGIIDVKNALARFYLDHGQIIELHGNTGMFYTETPQGKGKSVSEPRAVAPNRGRLKDVTITILETVGDPAHPTVRPSMTITMDNAAFDSENNTVITEAFQDLKTGATVEADRVPVMLRSPDTNPNGYDFDGRGLKMQWNERDHRLTSLDIAHGECLVIKNPKNMNEEPNAGSSRRLAASSQPITQPLASTQPTEQIADNAEGPPDDTADTTATTQPGVTKATTRVSVIRRGRRRVYLAPPPTIAKLTPNLEPPIYRAEFHNAVRIKQNGETLAIADLMTVDFWMENGGDSSTEAAGPEATGHHPRAYASTEPGQPGQPTERATAPVVAEQAPATAPAPVKITVAQPTTRPDEAPVYVYWTGPLHVIPHSEASVPLHKQIVTLIGAPVVAQQKNSQMLASKLVYNTDDGSLKATTPGVKGVDLRSFDPQHGKSDIHTTILDYFSRANPPTAVLSGPSTAQLPTEANGPPLLASWNERCTLRMQTMPNNGTELKEADLTGAVHIEHPQLRLDSQRLELFFVPLATTRPAKSSVASADADPTSQPAMQTNLKQLVASDSVHCVMFDSQHKEQTIDTNRLTVLTEPGPEGKLVPRTVNADGDVRAEDVDQILYAGHLATTLMPSTKPTTRRAKAVASADAPATQQNSADNQAIDLQSLIAQDRVHVIGKKNGSQAFADTMLVDNVNGKKTVKLIGQPFAEVIDKTNHVFGPIIDLASDDQQMAIDGPGHMVGVQQDGPTTRPMDVVWTQNMRGDGRTNLVNAYGNVVAKTVDQDGRLSEVHGDQAELLLVDAPATQPARKAATQTAGAPLSTTQVASTHPTSKPTGEEAMAKKTIRRATFIDNAHVSSTLLDMDGLILQRMNLYSSKVQYDVLPAPPGSPPGATMKKVTVPVPGTMLVEDYTKPEAQKADTSSPTGAASSRGATAFKWQKTMIYDDSTHRSIMDGDVIIDHLDDLNKDNGMHMTADTVIADLMSAPLAPATKTPAATKPTTKPDSGPHLRHVEAIGHVHVTMKNGELYASRIEYDPVTRIMIAHGTPDTDAIFSRTVSTPGGTQPMRGQLLQWDAANDLPTIIEGAGEMRR